MWILLIIMAFGFTKNLMPKEAGYNYMQDAISWLHSNRKPNANEVFYNDPRLRYYAKAPFIGSWPNNWQYTENSLSTSVDKFKYLAIMYSSKNIDRLDFIKSNYSEYKELMRFYDNKKNKFVVIYQRD